MALKINYTQDEANIRNEMLRFGGEEAARQLDKRAIDRQLEELGITNDYLLKTYSAQYWKNVEQSKYTGSLNKDATENFYEAMQMGINDYRRETDLKKSRAAATKGNIGLKAQTSIGSALSIYPEKQVALGAGIKK